MEVKFISNITKEYPDMYKVIVYHEPKPLVITEHSKRRQKDEVSNDFNPEISSLRRTKNLIRDIVLCNDFDLFCTFTFDPGKVSRFSWQSCWLRMSGFLRNQKNGKSPDLKYLIVPEKHKSGAYHFHALVSGFRGSLHDSHHKTASGRLIYNITSYRSGFSTAVKIDDRAAVANYVTKYITKDFIKEFGKHRFMCSQGLNRPVKTTNSPVFSLSLPLSRNFEYSTDDFDCYTIDKSFYGL